VVTRKEQHLILTAPSASGTPVAMTMKRQIVTKYRIYELAPDAQGVPVEEYWPDIKMTEWLKGTKIYERKTARLSPCRASIAAERYQNRCQPRFCIRRRQATAPPLPDFRFPDRARVFARQRVARSSSVPPHSAEEIPPFIGSWPNFDDHAASRKRRPSRSRPARPYVWHSMVSGRSICLSTGPCSRPHHRCSPRIVVG
jgi:hypothetical protein